MKHIREHDQEIREELDHVLSGPAFSSSQRSSQFLRYVVDETLAGNADQIKERSIGMAIFRRGTEYEPGADSIVRVKAVEVRKRLVRHYASQPASKIRIELPQGGYVPKFEVEPTPVLAQSSDPVAVKSEVARPWLWPALALTVLVLAGLTWPLVRPSSTGLDLLWRPMASSKAAVMIGLPSPVLYTVNGPVTAAIPPEDVIKVSNYFVGTGAAYGAAQVAAMLTARGGSFVVKVGQDVSYEDLKNQPAVFLGGHSSEWTMQFASKLRFQFLRENGQTGIIDTQQSGKRWMRTNQRYEAGAKEDYALVARIFDRSTGNPVMLVAGCGARGTHAAAEFVSSPEAFRQFTSVAPADWVKRNFEVVLRAELHGTVPGRPQAVAWHVW